MPSHVARSTTALRDLEQIVDYLKQDSPSVAARFLDATEHTFEFLCQNPNVGQRCEFTRSDMANVRVWPVDGFRNHLIFFRPTDDGVEVVRVLHGARDLGTLFGN
ncbi:MAG: type II toxin-antitoxin system RelE/ParE family toxin [Pirellulales bacterium]